jgi:hypothetical protein
MSTSYVLSFLIPIAIYGGLIVGGILLAALAAWCIKELSQTAILGLILLPLIVYALTTGFLSEFSGFGLSAKFNQAATTKVSDLGDAGSIILKRIQFDDADFHKFATIQACANYFVIRDTFGDRAAIAESEFFRLALSVARAIKSAMICGDFFGVVVVDGRDRFVGLFRRDRLLPLLAYPFDRYCDFGYKRCADQVDVSAVLAETELGPILRHPGVRADSDDAIKYVVQETTALGDILRRPDFKNTDVFAVVDASGKFKGLLPKQAVLDKVLLAVVR